jgi:hypothetical protein
MNRSLSLAVFLLLLVSACAVPLTPNEYRTAAKAGNALSLFESFDVNRPVAEVAATFKVKASECLSYKMGSSRGAGSKTHYYGVATPTVKKSKDKVELYFQVAYENEVGNVPEKGMYHLVADAYSRGKKTRVDIYRRTNAGVLAEAIKGWASGENLGCPDPETYL